MDERYELLAEAGCRDIAGYNETDVGGTQVRFNPSPERGAARIPRKLPYMVFIIDELADLMMTNKEVEGSIIRIAQKARAVGIHLILATQRPQANVVTGLIKSNMPCRIAFKVASGMDSASSSTRRAASCCSARATCSSSRPAPAKLTAARAPWWTTRRSARSSSSSAISRPLRSSGQLMQIRSEGSDEDRILASEQLLGLARRGPGRPDVRPCGRDRARDRGVAACPCSSAAWRSATRASRLIDLMGIAGIISTTRARSPARS
jgi:hypothetical protein